jgi:hypothetical protein
MMPNTPLAAAPLIARSGGYRSQSAPFAAVPQQPRVLARAPHAPQQLTLFGPPGGRR